MISSLPHTQLDKNYVSCAYSQKALKLARMMLSLGYKVITFGSEDTEIEHENYTHVSCMSKEEQEKYYGDPEAYKKTFYNITWGPEDEHWQVFNQRIIDYINAYKQENPTELVLFGTFAGLCQKQVADNIGNTMTSELGIGYTGVFSKYKVYESYAWMHFVHGRQDNDNGDFYETVIPNYWDEREFPLAEDVGDYYLFVGRLIDRKGYHIAQEVCEKLGKRLILAGQIEGEFKGYGQYIGTVDVETRGRLMSRAIAVFTPTTYLGPFEGVHIEAQLSGAPVITTNFGVYTETVENGLNGQRCNVFRDFVAAAEWAETLGLAHRAQIRQHAQAKWSMDVVKHQYDKYFDRLMDLYGDGWYAR